MSVAISSGRVRLVRALEACVAVFTFTHWMCSATVGFAIPVELFNSPVEIRCESSSTCGAIARSELTLGRYTGVAVSRRGAGSASVSVERNDGVMRFELHESSPVVLTLTWDGDQHPEQLSGAGLNCLDLGREGAYAFILSAISIDSECSANASGEGCPNFQIESRMYDAADPTGQRYSVSMMTRSLPDKTDLVIPFSNFVREGPRGKGKIGCVGAVSISFRFEDFDSVELELGPIYTNGPEGMTPLPTPTAAWTQTPETRPTEAVVPLASPTGLPTVASPTPVEMTPAPTQLSERPLFEPSPNGTLMASTPIVAHVPAAIEDEEVTYGRLVDGE